MNGSTDALELERALRRLRADEAEAEVVAERAARRAADEGLADVAYATTDSPVGELLIATTPRGLVRIAFPRQRPEDVLDDLAVRISPRILEAPAKLGEVRRELDQYLEGRRRDFDLPVDWRLTRGFRAEVLHRLTKVPYGETATYAELAARAGHPNAYRAAGSACGANPVPLVVPCHRVVPSGGGIGNYGGGVEVKRYLLELEGALGH